MSNGMCINPLSVSNKPQPIAGVLYILASQEGCDGEPYDQMCEAADYIRHLEAQLAERKWISVEDRLPPDSGDVLCHWTAYDIVTARLVHGRYWKKEGDNGEYYSVNAPTHWMKLPEPPKEASQ